MHIVHIWIAYHKSMQIKCQGNIDPTCRLTCKCVLTESLELTWTFIGKKENMSFRRNKDEIKLYLNESLLLKSNSG